MAGPHLRAAGALASHRPQSLVHTSPNQQNNRPSPRRPTTDDDMSTNHSTRMRNINIQSVIEGSPSHQPTCTRLRSRSFTRCSNCAHRPDSPTENRARRFVAPPCGDVSTGRLSRAAADAAAAAAAADAAADDDDDDDEDGDDSGDEEDVNNGRVLAPLARLACTAASELLLTALPPLTLPSAPLGGGASLIFLFTTSTIILSPRHTVPHLDFTSAWTRANESWQWQRRSWW